MTFEEYIVHQQYTDNPDDIVHGTLQLKQRQWLVKKTVCKMELLAQKKSEL
jgi:hypothetical protein